MSPDVAQCPWEKDHHMLTTAGLWGRIILTKKHETMCREGEVQGAMRASVGELVRPRGAGVGKTSGRMGRIREAGRLSLIQPCRFQTESSNAAESGLGVGGM